jgi:hypothetical protein
VEEKLFLSLPKLRKEMKNHGITTTTMYRHTQKKHRNWPSNPSHVYPDWASYPDLLGKKEKRLLTSLSELKGAVREANIKSAIEYKEYRQSRQGNWPGNPNLYYDDWVSWYDLFGIEKPKHLTLARLKKEIRKAGVRTSKEYLGIRKDHPEWPASPRQFYGDEWASSWKETLGGQYE